MDTVPATDFPEVLGTLESVLTSLAILTGAVWAYYHFVRKRVYRLRLKLGITGELIRGADGWFLLVRCELENRGVSKLDLQQEGSGFNVSSASMEALSDEIDLVKWSHVGTFAVFEEHRWIEAGESITEDHLLDVRTAGEKPVLLELRVVASRISFKSRSVVWASAQPG